MIRYFDSNKLVVLQSKVPVSAINHIDLHTVKKVTKIETICYLSQWVSCRVTQGNKRKENKKDHNQRYRNCNRYNNK